VGNIAGMLDLRGCTSMSDARVYAEGPNSGSLYVDDVTLAEIP